MTRTVLMILSPTFKKPCVRELIENNLFLLIPGKYFNRYKSSSTGVVEGLESTMLSKRLLILGKLLLLLDQQFNNAGFFLHMHECDFY